MRLRGPLKSFMTGDSVILSPDADVQAEVVHQQGSDCEQGQQLLPTGIPPSAPARYRSEHRLRDQVSRLPKLCLLTSGDEVLTRTDSRSLSNQSSHPPPFNL